MSQLETLHESLGARSVEEADAAASLDGIVVRALEEDEHLSWDTALDRSRFQSIFLKSCYLAALEEAFDIRIGRIGLFEQGRLTAGLAGRVNQTDSGPELDRIPLVPYAGVWMCQEGPSLPHRARRRNFRLLSRLSDSLQQTYRRVTFETYPGLLEIRPFVWRGWRSEARFTMINDLRDHDESRYDPDVRRRARNAASGSVRFVGDVPSCEFEEIRRQTLHRQNADDPLPAGALTRLLDRLKPGHDVRIYGARLPNGRLAAANVVVYDGDTAYYWMAGMDPLLSRSGANQLCVVEMLRDAARRAARFDWVGGNTPGVADFKESFGPTLTPYSRLRWTAPSNHRPMPSRRIWSWFRGRRRSGE